MLTQHQADLVRKFYLGVGWLQENNERFTAENAQRCLHKCIATDFINLNELGNIAPDLAEQQSAVFLKFANYYERENLSNRCSMVIATCLFVFAVYQFFESAWIVGRGTLVVVPIGAFVSNLIFMVVFTGGFPPLALGLTHTECRFACDEIVGHSRWNE